jgi:putative tryptophan/tyrosine transport system substrate-binding protein
VKRRTFIAGLGGAVAWPMAARAQRSGVPVVGCVVSGLADQSVIAAFRRGLGETGYVEGRNVTIEYHWLEGRLDQLASVMADLVRHRVAVIISSGNANIAIAAKAATATIPIVFALGDDPVKLGLVANLARPGGNATGVNFFFSEVVAKRLALLHELVPKAVRIATLVTSANGPGNDPNLRAVREATEVLGLKIQVVEADTSQEIDAAFAILARERPDALFVAPNLLFASRRVQLFTLAARHGIPATYSNRDYVEAGGLMSYGANVAELNRQVGVYTGNVLRGTKPADLPVMQATKFEFVINRQTARALGMDVPERLLAITDRKGARPRRAADAAGCRYRSDRMRTIACR